MQDEVISEDTILIEKREEIKRQLAESTYKTLGKVIADWTGRFIQKVTRSQRSLPFWYSMTITILVFLLIGYLIAISFNESYILSSKLVPFVVPLWVLSLVFVVALETYIDVAFTTARNHLLDAIISIDDLVDFQNQLISVFSIRKQLIFAIIYSILLTITGVYFSVVFIGGISGGIISVAALNIIGGSYFYFAVRGLPTLLRFSQYQFKLYTADPSKSEFIDRLSDTLAVGLYIVAVWATLYTLLLVAFGGVASLVITFIIIIAWVPTIAFFVISQYALARIITNAKWRTLNHIQTQIEELQIQEHILSEETLGHIDKLLDYHDRIAATQNSALNIRAGLNFLNSLLLPLIAFLLANLDQIIQLFFNI